MADYSTSLRTQYLNPRTHLKNKQTEFRFDKNTMYTSSIRLLNVAVIRDTSVAGYNRRAGILSLFKNVRLLDGSRELCSLRNGVDYLAFKNINTTNEKLHNMNDFLHKSFAALELRNTGDVHAASDSINQVTMNIDNFDDTKSGYVNLSLILPLLSSLPALDTSVFKNLRLVIEYSDVAKFVSENKTGVYTISEPVLAADEIIGQKKQAAMKAALKGAIVWNEIEHDLFQVPTGVQPAAALGQSVQEVNKVITGFDNKYVSRILLVKTFNDKTLNYDTTGARANIVKGDGNLVSLAMFKDELNVRHKGSNMFNGDALANAGFRQMLLQETWGDVVIPPFGALTMVGLDDPINQARNVSGVNKTLATTFFQSSLVGQCDYIGFQVEDYVKQLQFNYKRTIVKDDDASLKNSVAMDVHIYGEVRKQLSFTSNGDYDISYV